MTKQEAINQLKAIRSEFAVDMRLNDVEAFDMAIEALQRGLENVNADSCLEEPNRSDLISRQDAIDAILNLTSMESVDELREYAHRLTAQSWSYGVLESIDAVAYLPSAQPEQECEKCIFKPFKQFQTEIIRCKDCKDYQTDWEISHYPNRHYCATMDSTMPEDGFCSYAERRTDEAN